MSLSFGGPHGVCLQGQGSQDGGGDSASSSEVK